MSALNDKKAKPWPKNCVWPEPVKAGTGYYWEAEDADALPLDEAGEDLIAIKDYMDGLISEGRLNEDYSINSDYASCSDEMTDEIESWEPECGSEYWDENGFDFEAWNDDMVAQLNNLKLPLPSPVDDIQRVINYEFINENILRQAFTRRAFAAEYGVGDSEVLEFYGDSVLNTVIIRELAKLSSEVDGDSPCAPFSSDYNEGELTKIKQHYVNGEHLAARADALELDKYILYGTGEQESKSAKENMIEALIGAVAVDCGWDWHTLETVVDQLICFQISNAILRQSYYDMFNAWHQRRFGCMPDYELSKGMPIDSAMKEYRYLCTLRYSIPENDKDLWTSQRVDVQQKTRSEAREYAAMEAYSFLVSNGLWLNLSDAKIEPNQENSINQLQELFQKKYVDQPEYHFDDLNDCWRCRCICNGINGLGGGKTKTQAKKNAAFVVLVKLMMSAGLANEKMKTDMLNMLLN